MSLARRLPDGPWMPVARAVKWSVLPLWAGLRARIPVGELTGPIFFIIGCGRSGTTVLGQVIGARSDVAYLNEPLHYWHAIDRRTDCIGFFDHEGGRCWLDENDCQADAPRKMRRLFGQIRLGRVVVEKLPINALRLRWLNALYDDSRFVHIIRDGRAVVKSIQTISSCGTYRVAGRPRELNNQWWGYRRCKWRWLAAEGRCRGLFPDAVDAVGGEEPTNSSEMAAYEWLVSVLQARRDAEALALGSARYMEVRYEDLVRDPRSTLRRVEQFIGLPTDQEHIDAVGRLLKRNPPPTYELRLRSQLYEPFVDLQIRLGYDTAGIHPCRGVGEGSGTHRRPSS